MISRPTSTTAGAVGSGVVVATTAEFPRRRVPNRPREGEADDGIRTRDTWLGKPVLYQLSYVREAPRVAGFGDSAGSVMPDSCPKRCDPGDCSQSMLIRAMMPPTSTT